MNSNLDWVEANLQRQRKILEEKQKQRRLQSASTVRSTLPSSASSSSTLSSTLNPVFVVRTHEDYVSHPIEAKPSRSIDNLASTLASTTLNTRNETPTPVASLSSTTELFAPPVNTSKLAEGAEVIENSGSEAETENLVQVKPWLDETRLDEGVLEDCSNIDITKAIADLKNFVHEPVRRGGTMRCTITRDKKGVEKGWYPSYYLHWERDADKRFFLLAARRRKKCVTGSYLISIDPTQMSRDAKSFVGKVRANAVGTFFTVYDNGNNPKKAGAVAPESLRQEVAAIIYEKNVFGWNGPRKMTILLPGMYGEGMSIRREIRPVSEKETMIERFKDNRTEELIVLHNKTPIWSEDTQSFVLNFRGRVTQASVKNFQLIHEGNPDYIVLQFGRTNDSSFTLDFRYPLNPLQAFGIAMSSFHGKLACE
uniref:Tubby-like protein n=1 Tax=Panagrolaimus sp. JU765 TaxID=591449 RepID=A0AC34QX17_9BILA